MRVHVIQVGRVPVGEDVFSATRYRDALRAIIKGKETFPVYAFLVEHPDGHIVVDTGWHHAVATLPMWRFLGRRAGRVPFIEPDDEVGPRMRAIGLRPEDVRLVIPTHLDADHAGGIGSFPDSTILVNRAEFDYITTTRVGRVRGMAKFWPDWFRPSLYDLEPEPYGAFRQSWSVTDRGDVRIVPTPGHSPTHVSPVFEADGKKLLFAGDHLIRQSWITADGIRLSAMLHPYKRAARETNERLLSFVKEHPSIVLPSHDPDAAANVAAGVPLKF